MHVSEIVELVLCDDTLHVIVDQTTTIPPLSIFIASPVEPDLSTFRDGLNFALHIHTEACDVYTRIWVIIHIARLDSEIPVFQAASNAFIRIATSNLPVAVGSALAAELHVNYSIVGKMSQCVVEVHLSFCSTLHVVVHILVKTEEFAADSVYILSIDVVLCASRLDVHGNGIHDDHITLHCFLSVGVHVFLQGIYHCLSARIGRIQETVQWYQSAVGCGI